MIEGLLLLHGAGSGPEIFEGWSAAFPGVDAEAVDLHAGLNVAEASMSNYEAVAYRASEWPRRPLALLGWSMGGLVAMLAARRVKPMALVLLEPSPPAEVQGSRPQEALESGVFDPEAVYGPFPEGLRSRPESRLARAERQRGIGLTALPCPALVVHGDAYADERGRAVAARYGADELHFSGLDHWGLVLDHRVRVAVADWLVSQADAASSASPSRT